MRTSIKLLELLESEAEQRQASAAADRLTLATDSANRPRRKNLHLYTLTPDTSVPMYRRRDGFGRLEERAQLLTDAVGGQVNFRAVLVYDVSR